MVTRDPLRTKRNHALRNRRGPDFDGRGYLFRFFGANSVPSGRLFGFCFSLLFRRGGKPRELLKMLDSRCFAMSVGKHRHKWLAVYEFFPYAYRETSWKPPDVRVSCSEAIKYGRFSNKPLDFPKKLESKDPTQ